MQREGAIVAELLRQRLVLRRPIEEACKARPVQGQVAAESLPGRSIGDRAVHGQLGAAGQPGAQIVEQQRALLARDLEFYVADRVAAEGRLVEVEGDLAVGVLG